MRWRRTSPPSPRSRAWRVRARANCAPGRKRMHAARACVHARRDAREGQRASTGAHDLRAHAIRAGARQAPAGLWRMCANTFADPRCADAATGSALTTFHAIATLDPRAPAFRRVLQSEYRESDDAEWLMPVLRALMLRARHAAAAADRVLADRGGKADRSADVGQVLMRVFSEGLKRKRRATLATMNELFKLYFALNKHHLCKPLIRARDSPHFLPFASFPVAQRVTYLYFVGRLAVASERYAEADEHLGEAYARCHRRALSNLRAILEYWVPVRLLLGQVPSEEALRRYGLVHYVGIAAAVRTGDVARCARVRESRAMACEGCCRRPPTHSAQADAAAAPVALSRAPHAPQAGGGARVPPGALHQSGHVHHRGAAQALRVSHLV